MQAAIPINSLLSLLVGYVACTPATTAPRQKLQKQTRKTVRPEPEGADYEKLGDKAMPGSIREGHDQ